MGNFFSAGPDFEERAFDSLGLESNDNSYVSTLIGQGSLGRVYSCESKKLKNKIAKKCYRLSPAGATGSLSDDDKKSLDNIMDNIPKVLNLRHKNIVSYLMVTKIPDCFTAYFEYCTESTLAKLVAIRKENKSFFEEKTIYRYLGHIALGLQFLHDNNLIHRHMRPSNVMLCNGERDAKIADFGEGAILSDEYMMRLTVAGPPRYMAPEMASGMMYGKMVDIWALGIVIRDMTVLEVPTMRTPKFTINESFLSLNGTYSEELRALVKSMLDAEVKNRPTGQDITSLPMIALALAEC